MLKIGEFSKLSHLTVKALRFYEKEGILKPASVDERTGYRFYETNQLAEAAKISSYRRLGLTISEIKMILSGKEETEILQRKYDALIAERNLTDVRLSMIHQLLEDKEMKYQISVKTVPECIVYSCETVLEHYGDIMTWIPSVGEECLALNPDLKCAEPAYEFIEYLDCEHKEKDIHVRHNEAVTSFGKENGHIYFRTLPEAKVLSLYHKGAYDSIPNAYAFVAKYAEQNAYTIVGPARECYIDGIWNKESPDDWLTEVQLPIQ